MKRILAGVAGIAVLLSGLAMAEPRGEGPMGHGMGGRRQHDGGPGGKHIDGHGHMLERIVHSKAVAKKLGLDEAQVDTIRKALFDIKMEEVELRAKLEKAALNQARILMQDDVDEGALMESVEETGNVRTELAKLRIKPLLVIRETLTPEQLEQARTLLRQTMRQRKGGRKDGDRPREGNYERERERRKAEMMERRRLRKTETEARQAGREGEAAEEHE
jgi:Spy/CpxP family protein refolding chaperone